MASGLGEKSGCYPPLGRSLNGMWSMPEQNLVPDKASVCRYTATRSFTDMDNMLFFSCPFFHCCYSCLHDRTKAQHMLKKKEKKKKQLSLTYTFLSLPRNLPVICSFCSLNQFSPPTFLLCLSQLHKLCSLGSATGQAMKSVSFLDVCNN